MVSFGAVAALVALACCGRFVGGYVNAVGSSNSDTTLADTFDDVLRDEDNMIVDISTLAQKVALSPAASSSSVASIDGFIRNDDNGFDVVLPLKDQVRLLSKQMSALMDRRREDYKILETSLKNSVRKNSMQFGDVETRSELAKLR